MLLKDRTPINLVLLYAFATADGLLLGGVLEAYVQAGLGGAIVDAAATTAVVTIAASAYGVSTKRDLTNLRGVLTIGLFALLGTHRRVFCTPSGVPTRRRGNRSPPLHRIHHAGHAASRTNARRRRR